LRILISKERGEKAMHWHMANSDNTVTLTTDENSSNGSVWGTVQYGGLTYNVKGMWSASGAVTGRNVSIIQLAGSAAPANAPQAPNFLTLSGTISFNGQAPNITGMNLGVFVSSSNTGALDTVYTQLVPV
jgi:hypothetical protein